MKNSSNIKNLLCRLQKSTKKPAKISLFKQSLFIFTALSLTLLLGFVFAGCSTIMGTMESLEKEFSTEQQAETTQPAQTSPATEPQSTEKTEETAAEEDEDAADHIDTSPSAINVYYANSTGEYLVGEARTVSGENKLVDAFYELMKDPIDSSLHVLVPSSTKINSITVKDGLAKVDLSQEFLDDRFVSDTVDILLKFSIVNTLTEFKEVNSVIFYIDGAKLDILGQLDVKDPIYRRTDLIKN